jgi:hypothetical protein
MNIRTVEKYKLTNNVVGKYVYSIREHLPNFLNSGMVI